MSETNQKLAAYGEAIMLLAFGAIFSYLKPIIGIPVLIVLFVVGFLLIWKAYTKQPIMIAFLSALFSVVCLSAWQVYSTPALSTEQSSQLQLRSENTINIKQEIRTFLESISPRILDKIDSKEKKIGVWLGSISENKLSRLAEHTDFAKFLSFEKGNNIWVMTGKGTGKEEKDGLIRGVQESGTLMDYYLYPKDALIK